MTLKMSLDSLDGLDESTAKFYVEKDGKFVLDVDGDVTAEANRIPRSRLNAEIDKRKAAEQELASVAESLRNDVPEDMRELIPDLAPSKQIAWIRNASARGLFDPRSKESIDSKKPGGTPPTDFKNMSPQAIMAQGYKTK